MTMRPHCCPRPLLLDAAWEPCAVVAVRRSPPDTRHPVLALRGTPTPTRAEVTIPPCPRRPGLGTTRDAPPHPRPRATSHRHLRSPGTDAVVLAELPWLEATLEGSAATTLSS